MASGDIDQRVLGLLAAEASQHNQLLSSALYQVLGLSTVVAAKLCRASRLRRLDQSRQTRSLDLYHQIIWLSREGLALTEVYILPYCQDAESPREYRVMAARLRASFFHIFCIYHNNPPITQLRQIGVGNLPEPPKRGVLRDSIPSYTSESSYVTNPYASPPSVHVAPPLPMSSPRRTPARPPGLDTTQTYQPPVSSATYLLPAEDFTGHTRKYFEIALTLADGLLQPTHPMRLSVTLEYATFLFDCLGDTDASQKLCKRAIRAAYAEDEDCPDVRFEDATTLVLELARLAQKIEAVVATLSSQGEDDEEAANGYAEDRGASNGHAQSQGMTDSPLQYSTYPPGYPPPTRELPAPPHQYVNMHATLPAVLARGPISPPPSRELPALPKHARGLGLGISQLTESGGGSDGVGSVGAVTSKSSPLAPFSSENKAKQAGVNRKYPETEDKRRKSRASSGSSRSVKSRMEGSGTEKERKRRALEKAEDELMRKRSGVSDTNTVIRRR